MTPIDAHYSKPNSSINYPLYIISKLFQTKEKLLTYCNKLTKFELFHVVFLRSIFFLPNYPFLLVATLREREADIRHSHMSNVKYV